MLPVAQCINSRCQGLLRFCSSFTSSTESSSDASCWGTVLASFGDFAWRLTACWPRVLRIHSSSSIHFYTRLYRILEMDFESEPEMGNVPPWPFDTFTLSDGRSFQLADSVARSRCLDGCSLYTSRAILGSDGVVVKWCWSITRMHAVRIIETAVSSAKARGDLWIVDHLPHIIRYEERRVDHQDFGHEHGGSRTLQLLVEEELRPITELTDAEELGHAFLFFFFFWDVCSKGTQSAEAFQDPPSGLREFHPTMPGNMSVSNISLPVNSGGSVGFEPTAVTCTAAITAAGLIRLGLMAYPLEPGHAFLGIFKCYRWLYERCRLMHRNINLNNLMSRRVDGNVHGVLAGFDMAVVLEHSYKPHPENPLAFIACDLVEPSPLFPIDQYLYRFDLESLLYALVLITCHYEHGMLIPPEKQPFKCWHQVGSTDGDMYLEKIHLLTGGLGRWKPTPQFSSLFWLVGHLRESFKHGISAQDKFRYRKEVETGVVSEDGFDGDTLGGHVTFDSFEAVLRSKQPPSTPGRALASAEP
ncbi:hypothetical protein R3P38DRAFT_1328340 [Favolaschia claudopus]|uniref:Fungal-type protein kinase domain-containing protein n=1 Tax=Favolaschia claudopus TaxID=2862362 RepID=A0AAW0AUJ5_9AGAR